MKKNKESLMIALIILIFLTVIGIYIVKDKLTYLEFTAINEKSNSYVELNQIGDELIQEFYMPYDIMKGFSIKIGTFNRDNNSEWDILITDAKTNSIIYTDHFNASLISDNDYHYIKFNKNIKLDKKSLYKIHIIANNVNAMTGLAFYRIDQSIEGHSEKLHYNGLSVDGMLCFKIYGGDIDYWWIGLILFFSFVYFFIVIRFYLLKNKETDPKKDLILQSIGIGLLVFLLLFSFAVTGTFTDEFDNMQGGMIIARGGYFVCRLCYTTYTCSILFMWNFRFTWRRFSPAI